MHLNYAEVIKSLKYCYLSLDSLTLHRICHFVLLVDLHCKLLLQLLVQAEANLGVGAMAKIASELIVGEEAFGQFFCLNDIACYVTHGEKYV